MARWPTPVTIPASGGCAVRHPPSNTPSAAPVSTRPLQRRQRRAATACATVRRVRLATLAHTSILSSGIMRIMRSLVAGWSWQPHGNNYRKERCGARPAPFSHAHPPCVASRASRSHQRRARSAARPCTVLARTPRRSSLRPHGLRIPHTRRGSSYALCRSLSFSRLVVRSLPCSLLSAHSWLCACVPPHWRGGVQPSAARTRPSRL
jgi:hypothetical protein